MPNDRLFIGKDGNRYSDIWERNAADNRWEQQQEQIKELQKSNQLEQEKIEEERANAEKIAQATVQAERDKALYQAILQQQQHNFEEEQRKIRLCDDLGVDYEEIKLFESYLSNGSNELIEKINNINKTIEYKEKSLREYRNKRPDEQNILRKYNSKITSLQLDISKIKQEVKGTWLSQIMWDFCILVFGTVIVGCSIGIFDLEGLTVIKLALTLFILGNIGYRILVNIGGQAKRNNIKRSIKDLKRNKDKELKEFNSNKEKILLGYNERVSNYLKELEESKQEKEKIENENKQIQLDKYNKFMEFRTTHYNEEMEMLFRKLKLQSLTILDMAFEQKNGYIEECANKKGTVKEYIKYIREVIRNS